MEAPAQAVSGDITRSVERQIVERTGGRVRHLRVEAKPDRLTVSGLVRTYYVKQLVIQAVKEVLGCGAAIPLELIIDVGRSNPRPPGGYP